MKSDVKSVRMTGTGSVFGELRSHNDALSCGDLDGVNDQISHDDRPAVRSSVCCLNTAAARS